MPDLYPLTFAPLFRRYLWGGRRLKTLLDKPIGDGDDYAESWEIVDHDQDQSTVDRGPLQGMTLGQLVRDQGPALLGRHHPQRRFPLLLKFLDAHRDLSVQVHPNDTQAAQLDPPDLGKTEAWVIVHAEPGSLVYAGLKRGFNRQALEREVNRGTTELCLHRFEPQAGDCILVPAGTVHALGAGLVVAEIQQASDTTFRLFDWNRVGTDGQPRQLHIQAALQTIDYERGPVSPALPAATEFDAAERLAECDKFVLDRWTIREPTTLPLRNTCHLLTVLHGSMTIRAGRDTLPRQLGQSCLLPASLESVELNPDDPNGVTLLDMYLP